MPVRGDFIPGDAGPLAVVSWRPPEGVPPRFVALHLPAFGDEMNKSRRMVAMQARLFEAMGAAAFALDPRGTGDSGGDFGEATWDGWRSDALAAWKWIQAQHSGGAPMVLWGLRLGALLACDLASSGEIVPSALLLWHPVPAGRVFFDQFLRLASIQEIAGSGRAMERQALRAELAAGRRVDVGGYALHPALVLAADTVDLGRLPPPPCPVLWRDVAAGTTVGTSPVASMVASRWEAAGTRVDLATVRGPSFWAAVETEEAPALLSGTGEALAGVLASSSGDR